MPPIYATINGFTAIVLLFALWAIKNKKMNKYSLSLKDPLYLVFDAPLYKIRYGNYVTKNEAEIEKNNLKKKGYKTAWVVKSRIEQINLENNEK